MPVASSKTGYPIKQFGSIMSGALAEHIRTTDYLSKSHPKFRLLFPAENQSVLLSTVASRVTESGETEWLDEQPEKGADSWAQASCTATITFPPDVKSNDVLATLGRPSEGSARWTGETTVQITPHLTDGTIVKGFRAVLSPHEFGERHIPDKDGARFTFTMPEASEPACVWITRSDQ